MTVPNHARVFLWMLSFLKPYKYKAILFLLAGFIVTGIELFVPKVIQHFIDRILPDQDYRMFWLLLAALMGALILMIGSAALRNLLQRSIVEQAIRDIQFALFRQLRKLGFSYYEKNATGDTLSLFNTDMGAIADSYRRYMPGILRLGLFALVGMLFALGISWVLFLSILPSFLLYYLFGPYFARKAAELAQVSNRYRREIEKKAYNGVSALLELRVNAAEPWDFKQFTDNYGKLKKNVVREMFYLQGRGTVRKSTIQFGMIVTIVVGIYMVRKDAVTVGEFVAFLFYCSYFISNVTTMITLLTEQRVLLFQVKRVYDTMRLQPQVPEPSKPVTIDRIKGQITLHNVHFGYHPDSPILKGIDLNIQPGEKVALVGTSGNGKSTLIKLLGRFYDPTDGRISVDGVPLTEISLEQWRESIGLVFQETYLFGSTVRENILFGNPDATEEMVVQAAKAAYAHDFIVNLPQGYDTPVGERGIKLSGGQKQRLAIARMFIKNPAVVLLDEATSALDNVSEYEVKLALDSLLQGRTTVTVSHRLSSVRDYDKIVVVEQGRCMEIGTYEELMLRTGLFYRLAEGEAAS